MSASDIDKDLALVDVYEALDRSQVVMSPIVRDFIYSLVRLAYATGISDGVRMLVDDLREVGIDV